MINVEHRGDVAVLRMEHGRVNAMDAEMLAALVEVLGDVEAAGSRAAVLAGNGRVFSAGVDLRRYVEAERGYVPRLLGALSEVFVAVLRAPFPVVAMVEGPAVAGGAVLAAACDRRLLGAGARIGAPELTVGVPLPVAAIEVLGAACGRRLPEVLWTGRMFEGAEAVRIGLVDEVVAAEDLAGRALEVAGTLAGMSQPAVTLTKAHLRAPILERIADGAAADEQVRAVWASPETRSRVAAYLATLGGR